MTESRGRCAKVRADVTLMPNRAVNRGFRPPKGTTRNEADVFYSARRLFSLRLRAGMNRDEISAQKNDGTSVPSLHARKRAFQPFCVYSACHKFAFVRSIVIPS